MSLKKFVILKILAFAWVICIAAEAKSKSGVLRSLKRLITVKTFDTDNSSI